MMQPRDALIAAFCTAILAFAAAYCLAANGPYYYPLEHVWRGEKVAGVPVMSWYARVAWALLAATLAGAAAYFPFNILRRRSGGLLPAWLLPLLCIADFAAIVGVWIYMAVQEWHHWNVS